MPSITLDDLNAQRERLDNALSLVTERDSLNAEIEAERAKFNATMADKTNRVAELDREINHIYALGSGASATSGTTRRRGPSRGRTTIDRDAIVSIIRARQPVGAADIRAEYNSEDGRNIEGTSLSNVLAQLKKDGTLKSKGEKRGTRWSVA